MRPYRSGPSPAGTAFPTARPRTANAVSGRLCISRNVVVPHAASDCVRHHQLDRSTLSVASGFWANLGPSNQTIAVAAYSGNLRVAIPPLLLRTLMSTAGYAARY